jgi:AraC-like DNA-binding protein
MSVSLSQLRQAVTAKIEEISGFKLAKLPPQYFGRTQNTIAHKAFSVGFESSTAFNERQRRGVGVYISSPLRVIFSYRLRPLDIYPVDYDAALDAEQAIISKVLESYTGDNQFSIKYESSARQVIDSQEYIIITLLFTTLNTI